MDCHFLLQGIFLAQGLNLGLLHCRQIFYQLSYEGSSWFPKGGPISPNLTPAPSASWEALGKDQQVPAGRLDVTGEMGEADMGGVEDSSMGDI